GLRLGDHRRDVRRWRWYGRRRGGDRHVGSLGAGTDRYDRKQANEDHTRAQPRTHGIPPSVQYFSNGPTLSLQHLTLGDRDGRAPPALGLRDVDVLPAHGLGVRTRLHGEREVLSGSEVRGVSFPVAPLLRRRAATERHSHDHGYDESGRP